MYISRIVVFYICIYGRLYLSIYACTYSWLSKTYNRILGDGRLRLVVDRKCLYGADLGKKTTWRRWVESVKP